MSQHESSSTDETFGALVRTHRAALGCPPKLLVLRAFRATAPPELKEMLQDESVAAPDDPVMQELAPLVATVQTLPSVTRNQLMGLWQATLLLVVGCSDTRPHEVQDHNDTASDRC